MRLQELKHVHVVGVGGTLMGAFAAWLARSGVRVTGSDGPVYPPMSDVLARAKIERFEGYRAENLAQFETRPDLVVIGNVIQRSNPEARLAMDGGYAYASLPETMERLLLASTRNLVVSGTHGKTTTSSLLAFVLSKLGRDPSYFIGGVSLDLPDSFVVAAAPREFVLEGDEYDTAFWDKVPKFNHYLPDEVILTSVEYDHADIYPDLAAVIRAFEGLMERVRVGGGVIAFVDEANVRRVLERARPGSVIGYGAAPGEGVRYWPEAIRVERGETHFVCRRSDGLSVPVRLKLPGQHNVLNAIAVLALCIDRLGLEPLAVARALGAFQGVRRRQEERGEAGGVLVIDDFAHHPTAVRETLRALRDRYAGRRLVVAFEPRSATSRRKVFQQAYAEAFDDAEHVWIASPYDQSRIDAADQFSSEDLVAALRQRGRVAELLAPTESSSQAGVPMPAVAQLSGALRSGDVLAVLSNGSFGGLIPNLLKSLS